MLPWSNISLKSDKRLLFAFKTVPPVHTGLWLAVESVFLIKHIQSRTAQRELICVSPPWRLSPLPACSTEGSFQLFCVETGASLNQLLSSAAERPYILLLNILEGYFCSKTKNIVGWDEWSPGGNPAFALPF